MPRPFLPIAILYAGGLFIGSRMPLPLETLFPAAAAALLVAILIPRHRHRALALTLFLAGWTNFACRTAIISPHDLRLLQGETTTLATIRGTLLERPTPRTRTRDGQEIISTHVRLQASELRPHKGPWQPAHGQILVTTPEALPPEYCTGAQVEIQGVLSLPPRPLAPDLLDYRAYLQNQGIYYQLKTESLQDWQPPTTWPTRPLSDRFIHWAHATLAHGLPEQDEELRLLAAMTLGARTGLTQELYTPFTRSGTMHIFAISGLHIALIAGILTQILPLLRVSRIRSGLVVIPLLWCYTGATGWQPSAVRATIMMSIVVAGWALSRPSNLLNSLAAAAFIILLWDPQQLFGASFQLSFLVVLSIALIVPALTRIRDRLLRTDPFLPPDLAPTWRQRAHHHLRQIFDFSAVSAAAWIGSMPLTAYYFNLYSPVTLLANLILVPMSSLALASNLASLFCGPWYPAATELFNHSAWWWMHCMIRWTQWATTLPLAYNYVQKPGPLLLAFYYGTLLLWLGLPHFVRFKSRTKKILLPAACSLPLLLGGACAWQWTANRSATNLTIVPLSGGHAVYAAPSTPSPPLLIDCGNSNSVQFLLEPHLRAQGVNHLPTLVLTHGDLRHIGGAELVTDLFDINQLCVSTVPFRSPTYRRLMERYKSKSGHLRHLQFDEPLGLGNWQFLHPHPEDKFSIADENAVVLFAEFSGIHVLLLSDLAPRGQMSLLNRNPSLRATIVVSGLPVSGEPLLDPLLRSLKPSLIVIADSDYPANERASPALKSRLEASGAKVLYTRETGAVALRIDSKGQWTVRQ